MDDVPDPAPASPPGTGDFGVAVCRPADTSAVEYAMLYQTEKPRLMRYLIQCGASYDDAEDVAQRALAALYEGWAKVRDPKPWLRKVAARELSRSLAPSKRFPEDNDRLAASPRPAEVEAFIEEDAVLSALRRLPPRQRQVFALHFDQFTTSEIAGILRITDAAARQDLKRARDRLKELLGLTGHGATPSQSGLQPSPDLNEGGIHGPAAARWGR